MLVEIETQRRILKLFSFDPHCMFYPIKPETVKKEHQRNRRQSMTAPPRIMGSFGSDDDDDDEFMSDACNDNDT